MPSHNLLDFALHYASRGWKIFPLAPRSKKPLIPRERGGRGLRDATTDPNQIIAWWTACPDANIGLACGPSGLTVLDPDGPEGFATLRALVEQHGPLEPTLTCRTAAGAHLYYRGGAVRSTARGKLHVRAVGGYTVLPPSVHPSGWVYCWRDALATIADEPAWVAPWRAAMGGRPAGNDLDLGTLPAHLAGVERRTTPPHGQAWSAHDEARIRGALARVPSDNYEVWTSVGMALCSLGWDRPDGTSIGFDIWDAWSQGCAEKYALAALEQHWSSFTRSGIGIGTLFHLAGEHGWRGEVEGAQAGNFSVPKVNDPSAEIPPEHVAPVPLPPELNGVPALPAGLVAPASAAGGIVFPDTNDRGRPRATRENTKLALDGLGIACSLDVFHGTMLVGGRALGSWTGELADNAIHVLRDLVHAAYGFDPGQKNAEDAARARAIAHPFDPVLDYLDALEWDGVRRIDNWLSAYMGAPPDEWSSAVGRLFLVAAVRRAREPGCKWDHVVVLEGPENTGKSLALEILAGEENFSDMRILGRTEERQHEAVQGVWIYEIAELAGMKRAEVEHVKAFVTRKKESTRVAYAHFKTHAYRRCVFAGTTNESNYLKSDTGDRRFLPVRTRQVDLAGLRRDRDQLWAEADAAEERHGPLVLPAGLAERARREQAERQAVDGWFEAIEAHLRGRADTSVTEVLRGALHMQDRDLDHVTTVRGARILRQLGFERYQRRDGAARTWRYQRGGGVTSS